MAKKTKSAPNSPAQPGQVGLRCMQAITLKRSAEALRFRQTAGVIRRFFRGFRLEAVGE